MSSYKLTYLEGRGRAEFIRLIFAHAGVKYEDERVSFEKWPKIKPTTPAGTLPILQISEEDVVLSGSVAIARFLAEKYGIAGSTCLDNAQLGSIVDATLDVWNKIWQADFYEQDETRKAEKRKDNYERVLPEALARFEKRAVTNGAPEGWIWGNKLTYADFAVYLLVDHGLEHGLDVQSSYPTLCRLQASVESQPNIAKWLQERPKTAF